ncbi:hypothetical protein ACFYW8_39385 [Streptomyces sp. NPDC002742]|uniref:hypothetical protein n=1 Tax=unclassified Streptomyces TaxID=2593676 RepID=UPI001BE8CCC5|nr:hypothetical protein [Streptomyces sp. ISL-36]MBT2444764.1 hypothetical protein [Streptomyces sp. ISL-36]
MTDTTWAGVVVITDERYAMLARLAGQWLVEPQPEPIPIGEDSGYEDKAIYIAVNRNGNACYCGKTAPTRALNRGAAATRLGQHINGSTSKRDEWVEYWVIPLRDATPGHVVSALEKTVAARLGIPLVHRTRMPRRRT